MNKFKRIGICLLVMVLLVSTFTPTAYAYTYSVNSGTNGSAQEREYKIYKTWGSPITLCRKTAGKVSQVTNETVSYYGIFTYTIKNSDGKVVASGTWNAQNKSSLSLIRWSVNGTYTVTISKATFPSSLYEKWVSYPTYKITW